MEKIEEIVINITIGDTKEVYNFRLWKDYKNDCWVVALPNGDIVDFGTRDDAFTACNEYLDTL